MRITAYTFLAAILALGCTSKQDTGNTKKAAATEETAVTLTETQYKNAGLVLGQAETKPMYTALRVNGVIDVPPEKVYSISFPMGGYIKSTQLIPGMQLRKGELMATLEDQSFIQLQQDYLTAKARLAFDKADFERQKELQNSESNSQRVYQQAVANYESQKVLFKGLAEKLRLIGINPDKLSEDRISRTVGLYAPISGYIRKVNVTQGKYVTATDVLFELIDPSELHADLVVYEKDAQGLKAGQKVVCTSSNNPGEQFETRIEYITHSIDENRAVEVHCHLKTPNSKLLPGNFISAEIQLNNQSATVLPHDGIVTWQGKSYIFTTKDKKTFHLLPVTTGASVDGYSEIQSPLPQDLIVTQNAYVLLTMLKNKAED